MSTRNEFDVWIILSIGVLFIILGLTIITTPNLIQEIIDFFRDLEFVGFQDGLGFIEPASHHTNLYRAIAVAAGSLGIWNFFIGLVRVVKSDSRRKAVESFSGAFFTFGVAITFIMLMNQAISFRTIIPILVILGGSSILISALLNLTLSKRQQT